MLDVFPSYQKNFTSSKIHCIQGLSINKCCIRKANANTHWLLKAYLKFSVQQQGHKWKKKQEYQTFVQKWRLNNRECRKRASWPASLWTPLSSLDRETSRRDRWLNLCGSKSSPEHTCGRSRWSGLKTIAIINCYNRQILPLAVWGWPGLGARRSKTRPAPISPVQSSPVQSSPVQSSLV